MTAVSLIQSIRTFARTMSGEAGIFRTIRAWWRGYEETPIYEGDVNSPIEMDDIDPTTSLLLTNDEYVHVPWYMLNASEEKYELVRYLVKDSFDVYEDVEYDRSNVRHVIGDSLPLFDYVYVGKDLVTAAYDDKVHYAHVCYVEVRSAIRNIFECGVTDFFNKFEQTPPRSAIIQTPENVEFKVDSITFNDKNIKGFADKNNESTWTSDKLVDADFVKSKFNQLETQLNLLIRGMSSISNRLNTLENRLLSLENQS